MSEERVLKTLAGLGFSEVDAQVYVFLSKKGLQKGRDISRALKMGKQQLYPCLKNLQSKGIVSVTLEHPARFNAVPFEKVFDLFVKGKMEEVRLIQQSKDQILSDWQSIVISSTDDDSARFMVLEGRSRIYSRIQQMIQESKTQLLAMTTVASLAKLDDLGFFDATSNSLSESNVQFRFLAELDRQNIDLMKNTIGKVTRGKTNFQVRNPYLALKSFPRILVRDQEEILLFIRPVANSAIVEEDDACLWTNCKAIVSAFTTIFEELWRNSTETTSVVQEVDELPTEIESIAETKIAIDRYFKAMQSANEEIIIVTSPQGLIECADNLPILRECSQRGITVQILAPVMKDNFKAAQNLSEFCQIRHIPANQTCVTIIDKKELFQFKSFDNKTESETVFYSSNSSYVKKIENSLMNIWKSAIPVSDKTLESILGPYSSRPSDSILRKKKIDKFVILEEKEEITEKEIIEKILSAKRIPVKDLSKDLHIMYASGGSAIVHPPKAFGLPDLMFEIHHIEKHSGFGQGDAVTVFLWLKTAKGYMFVPAGGLGDNPQGVAFRKSNYAGYPAGENHRLVRKDELQVRVHGNTLFVGWTVPIPLLPPKYILPPACMLIEGYGNVKTNSYTILLPSGFRSKVESNGFDAFVTFMHPSSRYSGPGTDGFFVRDLVLTMTPPQTKQP